MAVPFHVPLVIVPVVTNDESPGYAVQLARLPLLGVPRAGVTSVGLVPNTSFPVPVTAAVIFGSIVVESEYYSGDGETCDVIL